MTGNGHRGHVRWLKPATSAARMAASSRAPCANPKHIRQKSESHGPSVQTAAQRCGLLASNPMSRIIAGAHLSARSAIIPLLKLRNIETPRH
jgi:hypothetical protein